MNKVGFSRNAEGLIESDIRKLLAISEQPGIISFAGGFPDPETFPRHQLARIAWEEITSNYGQVLQYTGTRGLASALRATAAWLKQTEGIEVDAASQLCFSAASQPSLFALAFTFIDPQDVVFCGLPAYIGGIQAFRAFRAHLAGIPVEDDGWNLEVLLEQIRIARLSGQRAKLIYVVPDFENPSGVCWSRDKRKVLIDIAKENNLLIVEDIPYRQIRFSGDPCPTLLSLDRDNVLALFTFSKTIAPGIRMGIVVAPERYSQKLVIAKQMMDLCQPTLNQRMVERFLSECDQEAHIQGLISCYRPKRDMMLALLEKHLGGIEGVSWTKPQGGLFLLMTLPQGVDTTQMLELAISRKVAYVPGKGFFVDGRTNTLRLNFSKPTIPEIKKGIPVLAEVIKETLAITPEVPALSKS